MLHAEVQPYLDDDRFEVFSPRIPHVNALDPNIVAYYLFAKDTVDAKGWFWLGHLFSQRTPNKSLWDFAKICSTVSEKIPDLGFKFVTSLGSVSRADKREADYEQMLQLFSEVLCIKQILEMPWPENTDFFYEPEGNNGKRPELRVIQYGIAYNFEVKAPSLLKHQRKRSEAPMQIPARMHPDVMAAIRQSDREVLLPRDNPIKEFLIDANEKFSGFGRENGANILLIVWDDFIYEPLASLLSPEAGLLTENTFHVMDERPVIYDHIDAVICLRHLNVFQEALAERELSDGRSSMFDFGANPYTPNVLIRTPWGNEIPEFFADGLNALENDDDRLTSVAEYRIQDYVIWI
jgi:hypothetical protein